MINASRNIRVKLLWAALALAMFALFARLAYLQISDGDKGHLFIKHQGDLRVLRKETIPAGRGEIVDRHGNLLAYSTPVQTVWANPRAFEYNQHAVKQLAGILDIDQALLAKRLRSKKGFVYLKRQVDPDTAQRVLSLDLAGVHAQREYKRYYPAAEFASHLIGFTDIEDRGQEGVELAYDEMLSGEPGQRQVMRNAIGEPIRDIQLLRPANEGAKLQLAIDINLQYATYRELKTAVHRHQARSGSAIVLDAQTGEVLALVNQPSYNVNDRTQLLPVNTRNRALVDLFEPGSTVKPFTLAAALQAQVIRANSVIDTTPGKIRLGNKVIVDPKNYGRLSIREVLSKSSQVGTTKIALAVPPESMRELFADVGFGEYCATGFPGEGVGFLPHHRKWQPMQRAALSFGHGLSVNVMQLARAYAILASDGIKRSVTLLKKPDNAGVEDGERVMSAAIAEKVRSMMVDVVDVGTGQAAAVPGYSVAGKTGTTHRVGRGGYEDNRYRATFAGMLPASAPRIVVVITIDDPRGEQYYGGEIAAPVFAGIANAATRMLNITPDRPEQLEVRTAGGQLFSTRLANSRPVKHAGRG
ncbi:MAG: penicillin-binding protein 2 [Gammaproteobacteria bacterium]|nr:penicillin-binding protein 2 [Gammaproteobacteria bacterium]MBT8151772.1 penicillin-binding protein 2 [Gammaproteobacteria bacterium]